jgi:peptidoglycan/LPS O-acetylase OafA/YrhL
MQNEIVSPQIDRTTRESTRLHYLDWLRVIAILMVFLFHAVHPFDLTDWHIKNAEQSMALTAVIVLLGLWGMPFFFMMAGAGSWFALQRRTPRQYIDERFKRLLIPFIVGAILLMPIMLYFEWSHWTAKGEWHISFQDFVLNRNVGFSPRWFGALGYHLWYLGFLFSFALITLPLFRWLKGPSGQRLIARLANGCERRGGILMFILPLMVVQLGLRPFFPIQHDWADFMFRMSFFALGFVLFADERFMRALRRDWRLILAVAIVVTGVLVAMMAVGDPFTWSETPSLPEFYLIWALITIVAWCWTIFMLFVGLRFLNFTNKWLQYGQEAILPFFVLHQPVIIVIAFFVVQLEASILIKMLIVVPSSFVVCVGLYELIIKRIGLLRAMFGVKPRRLTA